MGIDQWYLDLTCVIRDYDQRPLHGDCLKIGCVNSTSDARINADDKVDKPVHKFYFRPECIRSERSRRTSSGADNFQFKREQFEGQG